MKATEILNAAKGTNFTVRVYSDTEICLMEDNDRADNSSFAVLVERSGEFEDYVDENHKVQRDDCDDEFVEWLNEDLNAPFSNEDIDERIEYYEQFNN